MASLFSRSAPRALGQAGRLATRQPMVYRSQAAPIVRRTMATSFNYNEQPRLRLGSVAPDFSAQTTHGQIESFHSWVHLLTRAFLSQDTTNGQQIGDSWAILFSHPADFTPVCTTELGAFAKLAGEFEKRNVKMIGLSANDIGSHDKWIEDINEVSNTNLKFPIIGDADRKV